MPKSLLRWEHLLPRCMSLLLIGTVAMPAWSAGELSVLLTERVSAIGKQSQELERWFRAELIAAKHDNDKVVKANREHQEANRKLAEKLKALIKENGAQPEAFDAVLTLVGEVRYYLDAQETQIVLDHHLASPKLGQLCFQLRYRSGEGWARKILQAAAEKHPSETVRGQAVFALGDNYRAEAMPYGRELPEDTRATLLAKAAQYYRQTVEQYAQTPTPDGKTTLGEKARHELARIHNLPNLVVGGTAPPIVGDDLDGQPLRLEDHRGKVVLLVFWGSWCGPCMAMVPHECELFARHQGKPFVLLGVNCGDTRETALPTIKDKQMPWRHWWDGDEIRGPIETDYNVPHWPRIFVIDAQGIIRGIDPEEKELDEVIEKALGEV